MERLIRFKPYLLMLCLIVVITGIRYALTPILQFTGPLVLYFLPVAAAAVYGGARLTLFTTLVSVVMADILFIPPRFTLIADNPADMILLGMFTFVGIMFAIAGEVNYRSRRRSAQLMSSLSDAKQAIELNEQTMHALLESSSQGIFGVDTEGRIRIANGTAHRMFGYLPRELIGQSIEILIDQPQRSAHKQHRKAFFDMPRERPMMHGLDLKGRRKDGSMFPIEALITVTDTPTGRLGVSFVSDITQRRDMEAALLRERSELRSLLDHTPVLVSLQNLDGTIHLANRSFAQVLGVDPSDMIGRPMQEVFPHSLAEKVSASNQQVISSRKPDELEIEIEHRNGEKHTYHLVKFPLNYLNTDIPFGVGGFAIDISELKKAEEKIRHAAQHDPLTGLPNRALIYEMGAHLISAAHRHKNKLAVMFFDLDRFKPINDTYGHRIGDLMLKEVARRLHSTVRGSDLVGRLGGDEFVAILTELKSDADLETVASHLLHSLRQPYRIEALELHTSPSIGISLYDHDGTDIDALIRRADAAMYHAKSQGRNNYQYYSEEIRTNSSRVFALEQRLRRSLHEEDFELIYQPIIEMHSGRLAAVEALIRWRQSDGGELLPGDFIAAAEASGLIHQIGEWVIREACSQFERWRHMGLPPVRIAVNVSPIQFRSPDFRDRLVGVLDNSTMPPQWLELEVTESTVMSRVEEATKTLNWLKELGLHIALDDFGTGYSSLSHLAQLPIDKLKVDRAFITHIDSDKRSLAIAETVIALGQKLGVEVVAEGIENDSALAILRQQGCSHGQGYLIAAPMRAEQLPDWQRSWAAEREVVTA